MFYNFFSWAKKFSVVFTRHIGCIFAVFVPCAVIAPDVSAFDKTPEVFNHNCLVANGIVNDEVYFSQYAHVFVSKPDVCELFTESRSEFGCGGAFLIAFSENKREPISYKSAGEHACNGEATSNNSNLVWSQLDYVVAALIGGVVGLCIGCVIVLLAFSWLDAGRRPSRRLL